MAGAAVGAVAGTMAGNALAGALPSDKDAKANQDYLDTIRKFLQVSPGSIVLLRGHVDNAMVADFERQGGASLVSQYKGLSADHIEYLDDAGVQAMAESGTVAVLLPGAFYFLQERQRPPVEQLRKQGVPMAVATDYNPGTSPFASLHLAMNMACVQFGLTPEEAWAGVTRHAAQALGRGATHGQLRAGFVADFIVWDAHHPVEMVYEPGRNPLYQRIFRGEAV